MRTMRVQIPPFHPDPRTHALTRGGTDTDGTVAERLMHFAVDEDDDGSSPFGPAKPQIHRLCGWLRIARLAEIAQLRFEKPKRPGRYQERSPFFPNRPRERTASS